MTRKKSKATRVPRLSRTALNREITGLAERLAVHSYNMHAVVNTTKPNGQEIVAVHEVKTAIGLQLSALLRSLEHIEEMAQMVMCAAVRRA